MITIIIKRSRHNENPVTLVAGVLVSRPLARGVLAFLHDAVKTKELGRGVASSRREAPN